MIASAYCGYCSAVFSALENDLANSDCTADVTWSEFGDCSMSLLTDAA